MFRAFKSSVTVALHVLRGLPLPLKPSISKWVHLLIYLSLLSHAHTILDDLTSAFIPKVQESIARTLLTGIHCLQLLS